MTGFTSLSDGAFVVAITPVPTKRKGSGPTRLILGPFPTTVTIAGLKKEEQLKSLLGTKDGRLLGLVVKKNDTPPVRLVEIDEKTGNFTGKLNFPGTSGSVISPSAPEHSILMALIRTATLRCYFWTCRRGTPILSRS